MKTVAELTVDECWSRLRTESVGRIALVSAGHPEIFPVNYKVDQGSVLIRTGKGLTMANHARGGCEIALEVDQALSGSGGAPEWSVVVRGYAHWMTKRDDIAAVAELLCFPWELGLDPVLIRIQPTDVTGHNAPG